MFAIRDIFLILSGEVKGGTVGSFMMQVLGGVPQDLTVRGKRCAEFNGCFAAFPIPVSHYSFSARKICRNEITKILFYSIIAGTKSLGSGNFHNMYAPGSASDNKCCSKYDYHFSDVIFG